MLFFTVILILVNIALTAMLVFNDEIREKMRGKK